jgi:glycosyltransferase involved in cell wall biosynthesis
MISIVTCYKNWTQQVLQERNIAKTVGMEHEYLALDGSASSANFAAAYNQAVSRARGDLIVFIEHDCFFMNERWGRVLSAKFADNPALGIAGVAGTQYLYADKYSWTAAGRPYVKGRIVYHLQNDDFFAAVFSTEKVDSPVVACDGCIMAVRRDLFPVCRFDEQTFSGQYFYDLDFCLQARRSVTIIVTNEVTIKRRFQPSFNEQWRAAGEAFLRKNQALLPASCVDSVPDPEHFIASSVVNLKGKTSSATIC